MGFPLPPLNPSLKNVAAVTVQADLPPFAKPGQTIDVTVSDMLPASEGRGARGSFDRGGDALELFELLDFFEIRERIEILGIESRSRRALRGELVSSQRPTASWRLCNPAGRRVWIRG